MEQLATLISNPIFGTIVIGIIVTFIFKQIGLFEKLFGWLMYAMVRDMKDMQKEIEGLKSKTSKFVSDDKIKELYEGNRDKIELQGKLLFAAQEQLTQHTKDTDRLDHRMTEAEKDINKMENIPGRVEKLETNLNNIKESLSSLDRKQDAHFEKLMAAMLDGAAIKGEMKGRRHD